MSTVFVLLAPYVSVSGVNVVTNICACSAVYSALVSWICTTVSDSVVTVLMVSCRNTSPASEMMEAGEKKEDLVMSELLRFGGGGLVAFAKSSVMRPP